MLKLLAATLIALGWLVPNHYPPWVMFYNEVATAVGLLVLAVDASSWRGSRGLCTAAWAITALIVVPWCQWSAGLLNFSGDAWVVSLYLAGCATAIQVGYEQGRVDAIQFAGLLAIATLVAGFVSSLLAINQIFQTALLGIWSLDGGAGMRATANLAQPNHLATLIGLSALALLLLYERGRLSATSSLAIFVVLILAAGLTQSRAALTFGPLIVVAAWFFKRRGVPIKTGSLTLIAVTIFHWIVTATWPMLQSAVFSDAPLTLVERGVQSFRFRVWALLIDALSLSPWKGYGWLQVGAAELAAADRHDPVGELWLQGHNLFLELLIWCGYPLGLLLCAGVIYWTVTRLIRILTLEAAVGWMTIGVLGAHSMLEFPYQYAYFLLPAGLWIGLIEASIGALPSFGRTWRMALFGTAFLLLGAIVKDYPAVEDSYRLMRFESQRIGSVHAKEPAPDAPFLSSTTALLHYIRTPPVAGMSPAQLAAMKAMTERFPYSGSIMRYGTALALNGHADEARSMFIKLRTIYGQAKYDEVRSDLLERAADIQPALGALAKSLPK